MGTVIALSVGGIDVAWSKNSMGMDHGDLFQTEDRKRFSSDQVNYDAFENPDDAELAEMETGFIKPLHLVKSRLELLGYTLDRVRSDYDHAAMASGEHNAEMDELGIPLPTEFVSFDAFLSFISEFGVSELNDTAYFDSDDMTKESIKGRFKNRDIIERLPYFDPYDDQAYSERSYFGGFLGFLPPYAILRALAENPKNRDVAVTWQYGPLVNSGWEKAELFQPLARRRQTFLIATEGSTDAHVLRHAIELLRPEISDFFQFIDMSERHPFPGTGNLHKFAEGLSKIDVHNQLVLVYDNDAEGLATFERTKKLTLPKNMRVAVLPDLLDFKSFPTVGPDGLKEMDINGRAAAIECYLDLQGPKTPQPIVRWSNYNTDIGEYQGALEQKGKFMKSFLKLRPDTFESSGYNTEKIGKVLDMLYAECCSIAKNI